MKKLIIDFRNFAKAPNKRQTSMPSTGFEPAIPAIEKPHAYAIDGTATGIVIPALSCMSSWSYSELSTATT
jgi:hypothetical protein